MNLCSLKQFFYSGGLHNYTKPYVCLFFFLNIYFWSWTSANSTTQENDIYHPESSHYSLLYQFNVEKKKTAINQNLQLVF